MISLLSILLLSEKIAVSLEKGILGTLLYSAIGIVMCVVAYYVIDLIIPGKMGKQIAEDKNMAIAIVAGSMILGVCIIIAAAIAG